MTKETKIGLLVGLAFIILFAIILSEKGTTHRSSALPTFTVADASDLGDPGSISDQPLSAAGRLPVDAQLSPIVKPQPAIATGNSMVEEQVVLSTPTANETVAPLPASVVSMLNAPVESARPAANTPAVSNPAHTTPAVAANPRPMMGPPVPNQRPQPPTTETRIAANTSAPPVTVAPKSDTSPTVPQIQVASAQQPLSKTNPAAATAQPELKPEPVPAAKPSAPLIIKKLHVVEKGQSLGKIAAQYYGRSTPARVQALYEANRSEMKNPAAVKAGQTLKIPDLGEANSSFEPTTTLALSSGMPVTSPQRTTTNDRATGGQLRIPVPIAEKSSSTTALPDSFVSSAVPNTRTNIPSAKPTPSKQATASAFILYEVQPKDTLAGIARRQLGSERLHSEIYKLNRDLLRNKNTIRPGMKLRLPIPSAAEPTSLGGTPNTALTSIGPDAID